MLVNLEITIPDLGVNQLHETVELARRMSTKAHTAPYWLDWSVVTMFACNKENRRDTLISVILERRMLSLSPKELLKYIKRMVTLPFHEMIAYNKHKLHQRFNKHFYNEQNDNSNSTLCANPASTAFDSYAPKVLKTDSKIIDESACIYCQPIPVNESKVSSFFITELYYCDQVVFNETEFERMGHSVYVHAINKVFHELEYQIVKRDARSFVHVCADKAAYVPVRNQGISVQETVQSFIVLMFYEKLIQTALG